MAPCRGPGNHIYDDETLAMHQRPLEANLAEKSHGTAKVQIRCSHGVAGNLHLSAPFGRRKVVECWQCLAAATADPSAAGFEYPLHQSCCNEPLAAIS